MGNTLIVKGTTSSNWYVSDGITKRLLGNANVTKQEEANVLVFVWGVGAGTPSGGNQQPIVVDQDIVNKIVTV